MQIPSGHSVSIHQKMLDLGVSIDNWCSDLYVPVTPETTAIIDQYEFKCNVQKFRNQIDGTLWYDIPFAYEKDLQT